MDTVLNIPTEAYPGAHFATFPRKLVEPCIRAGTSEKGCCPRCGAGWVRESEQVGLAVDRWSSSYALADEVGGTHRERTTRRIMATVAWRPACSCFGHFVELDDEPENPYARPRRVYVPDGPQPDPVPAVVLDPFAGSGTTMVVASALGRSAIGIDLSTDYLALARRRIERPHAAAPRPARDEAFPLFAGMDG